MTPGTRVRIAVCITAVLTAAGCATKARELMPTPLLYQQAGGPPVFDERGVGATGIDLFYVTDRGESTPQEEELGLPYGESRGRRVAFGSARVDLEPPLTWEELETQSRLGARTRPITLELGTVLEIATYPREPYQIQALPNGGVIRDPSAQGDHDRASRALAVELERRLAVSPRKEVILYIHGFNETFATAAFTAAELCHFLGREPVCAFFTWPASHTGNFLISYTNTTESADYSVDHLKKAIRVIASQPAVERVHLLAHSRGAALTLEAAHQLLIESIAAGRDPFESLKIGELVFFSPDVDMEIAAQRITAYISDPDLMSTWTEQRLPRGLQGKLTIYTSPEDRALLVARILFRSRYRLGQITAEDLEPGAQEFLARLRKIDLITYEGKRTDFFGHSYFTSNPVVSSDLIQLLRYGRRLGDPGRALVQTGPVTWSFPKDKMQEGSNMHSSARDWIWSYR